MNPSLDLEKSIAAWRAEITAHDPLRETGLDELETHLRDVFADLRARGLTDGEAFYLARRRTGGAEVVEELKKVHPDTVWAERGKWMIFGVLAFEVFWSGLHMLASLIQMGIDRLTPVGTVSVIASLLTTLGMLGLFGGALTLLIRGKWRLGGLERFTALRHPAVLAAIVGFMFLAERALGTLRIIFLVNMSQSSGFAKSILTSRYFELGLAMGTLILLALACAFAGRRVRRIA